LEKRDTYVLRKFDDPFYLNSCLWVRDGV